MSRATATPVRDGWPLYVGASLLLGASALLAQAAEERAPRPALSAWSEGTEATRIVSVTLSTDEMLLALEPGERLVALSIFADDPAASNVVEAAARVSARVHGEAERILALSPDLVITNPYTQPEAMALLAQSRVPVLTVAPATSFEGIEANLRSLARAVDERERGETLIAEMNAKLTAVRGAVADRPRQDVFLYNRGGYTPGAGTLFDELVQIAGGRNLAAALGRRDHTVMHDETLLELDPEVILVVDYAADGRGRDVVPAPAFAETPIYRGLRAVREGRVYPISPKRVLSASHHAADGAIELARILHPELAL